MDLNCLLQTDAVRWLAVFSVEFFLLGFLVGRFSKRQVRRARKKSAKGGAKGTTEIYVGNLSYDTSERDLRNRFEKHGKVLSARIIRNNSSGKSKGFGFVEMADPAQAMVAIRKLNGSQFDERRIVVNEAKSRSRS